MNHKQQNKKYNKYDKHDKHNSYQQKTIIKEKSYSDLVSEISYLKNKISGLINYGENLNELNIALGERFEKLQSYIKNTYLQPEIKKLTDENKKLTDENKKLTDENKKLLNINEQLKQNYEILENESIQIKELRNLDNENLNSELEIYKKRCSELDEINNFLRICLQESEQKIKKSSSNYGYITLITFIFIIICLISYSLI